MSDSSKLLTCAEFRALRDQFQAQRRAQVYPLLKAELEALEAKIKPLTVKRDKADKHHRTAVEYDLKPLWFEKQYLLGQIAMIEDGK